MVVTLGVPLDADHVLAVESLRQRVGAPGSPASCPHLSLAVLLDAPDPPVLDAALRRVAERTAPFSVRARGFGVFDDGDGLPVLHVPVVRADELHRLHRDLHDEVVAAGGRVDGHYGASSWFPHVTLWSAPTPDELAAAVAELAAGPPVAWTLPVAALGRLDRSGLAAVVDLGVRP